MRSEEAKSPGVATGLARKSRRKAEISEQNPPPRPPARKPVATPSACEMHREWIESQVALGRNAMSIYQDLVESVRLHPPVQLGQALRARAARPASRSASTCSMPARGGGAGRFRQGRADAAAERQVPPAVSVRDDAQVLGQELPQGRVEGRSGDLGAAARGGVPRVRRFGRIRRARQLEAGRASSRICTSRIYNPVYAAMLAHYGAVADAARVADPDRKGTVETAIQHTQDTALKGRKFESIEEQNAWLAHWEERWAAPRIHGRKKRQVLAMFAEEKPHAQAAAARALPLLPQETSHTVDDSRRWCRSLRSYYAALPAPLYSEVVTVRIYEHEIEILDAAGAAAAPASAIDDARALRDAEDGPDLQSLARDRAAARQSRQDRPALPRSSAARSSLALGPPRAEGALRPDQPAAPLREARTSRRACEARAHLEPAVLSGPQAHPRASRRRDARAGADHARAAADRPAHPRHRGIPAPSSRDAQHRSDDQTTQNP